MDTGILLTGTGLWLIFQLLHVHMQSDQQNAACGIAGGTRVQSCSKIFVCRYTAVTSSEDGSVRVWDTWNVAQKTVIKPTLKKPGRVAVSMARFNRDGRLIVAGLNNGTIQLWDVKGESITS